MEYEVQVLQKLHEEVDVTSYKFWHADYVARLQPEDVKELLPRLIPMFLADMTYADDDESLLDAEEDENVPDKEQVDDSTKVNNLREGSAKAIEKLSNGFGDEIVLTIMPLIKARLSFVHDEDWKEREVGVFALGAIAEAGCINVLYPYISEFVHFLLPLLDNKFPLIRSITCWTLRRYSKYLIQENSHRPKDYHEKFEKVLMGLLRTLLDTSKRVQEAACSAIVILEEDAGKDLVPHIKVILQHLLCAFGMYQKRNLRIVYDAIGTLAESVGEELNKLVYIEILMPPLVSKWPPLSISYKDVFSLLNCFTSLYKALGEGFTPFAQPILQKCMHIIQLEDLFDPVSDGTHYDKKIIVCSLKCIAGLAERFGNAIDSQDFQNNLVDLLCKVIKDEDINVKISTFSLLGDLIRALGVGFAQQVFRRCMDIFQLQQLDEAELALFDAKNIKKSVSSSLQLLCGLANELGSGIHSMVSKSNLRDVLLKCCMDESRDVRNDAFALVCDLARVFTVYLQPRLHEFLEIASMQLSFDFVRENFYAANNACWVIGELVVKFPQEVSPLVVVNVVTSLGTYLRHKETLVARLEAILVEKSKATGAEQIEIIILVNSAVTLGILAWIYPYLVAPHMENYMEPWCMALSLIHDDIKKEEAFRGLCEVVKVNPFRVINSIGYICFAIASWQEIRNEDVKQECSEVLNGYKHLLGDSWEVLLSGFCPPVRESLARYIMICWLWSEADPHFGVISSPSSQYFRVYASYALHMNFKGSRILHTELNPLSWSNPWPESY